MSNKNICGKCHQSIDGGSNAVIALGKKFHATCFVCPTCRQPFEKGFLDHRGEPYHEHCMPADEGASSRDCSGCHKAIEDMVISAAGKSWHTQCFKCEGCRVVIDGNGAFDMFNDKIYHPTCVPSEALPTCHACRQQCHEHIIVFEGNFYHDKCVPKCAKCHLALSTTGKYVQQGNDFYHHPGCTPPEEVCTACHQRLTNPAIEIEGRMMHKNCFKCSACHEAFERWGDCIEFVRIFHVPSRSTYVKIDDKFLHEKCQPGRK